MAIFTGTSTSETITPITVSGTVTRSPLGSLPSNADDTIDGNGGADTMDGGAGNDTIYGGSGNDTIIAGLGNDYIDAGLGADTISYLGATANVIMDLSLSTAQNTIGGGTDTLLNFENVIGSALDDQITGTVGDNILNGGLGADWVSYVNALAGVTVNLGTTTAQNTGGAGTDTLVSFEYLMGSNFGDRLTGDAGTNVIYGMDGDDVLFGLGGSDLLAGGGGNDILLGDDGNDSFIGNAGNDIFNGGAGLDMVSYGDVTAGVTVDLRNGAAQNTGGDGIDTLVLGTIEELGGSMHNDVLTGDGADNVLIGLAGDDQLNGGAGNDGLIDGAGDDILNGGAGQDTVSYGGAIGGAVTGVVVDLTIEGGQNTGGAGIDTLVSIENLGGSDFNDMLTGDSADNRLSGWRGNDVLNGGSGNDTLIGDVGDDTLNGGSGTDTASYAERVVGVTVNLGLVGPQNTVGAGLDTLVSVENLTGSSLNDILIGSSGNNVIEGLAGNDVLNGGGGTDTASYNTTLGGVKVNLGLVTAQNTLGAGIDTLSNFENLTGSRFNDTLTGNAGRNLLSGGLGNDILNGGLGDDQLRGDSGNDTLRGGGGNDALIGGAGADLLLGGAGRDSLDGGSGNDIFDYNSVSESPTGSSNRDSILNFNGNGTSVGDRIDLRDIDAKVLVAGNQAFTYIGSALFTAAGQLRYSNGILSGSTDADTAAEFQIQLVGSPSLTVVGLGTDILL